MIDSMKKMKCLQKSYFFLRRVKIMYWYETYRDEDSEWHWRLWTPFNRILAISPTGYPSYELCVRAINILKEKGLYAQVNTGNTE